MDNDKSHEEIYQELVEHSPKVAEFFRYSDFQWTAKCSDHTGIKLKELWLKNIKLNLRKFPELPLVKDICSGFGSNKAAVLIGAGPSINKDKKLLANLCMQNANFPFEQQPFLFICSNHQFKPCLRKGIIPHFVLLMDASDVVYDQLCVDIPEYAKHVYLLANFRSDPKVLKTWERQGRKILWFMLQSEWMYDEIKKLTDNEHILTKAIVPGGNVINQAWLLAFAYMNCTVFMALGNDLSYDYDKDLEERRKSYYGDKDYSTNIGTGRDEAKKVIPWLGFEQRESSIVPGNYIFEHKPKATTVQLMLYKVWLESRIGVQAEHHKAFHYYNCSDGILGMLSKQEGALLDKESFDDPDNWYLLDEVFPKYYHTKPLPVAADEFLQARSMLWQKEEKAIPTGSVVSAR